MFEAFTFTHHSLSDSNRATSTPASSVRGVMSAMMVSEATMWIPWEQPKGQRSGWDGEPGSWWHHWATEPTLWPQTFCPCICSRVWIPICWEHRKGHSILVTNLKSTHLSLMKPSQSGARSSHLNEERGQSHICLPFTAYWLNSIREGLLYEPGTK